MASSLSCADRSSTAVTYPAIALVACMEFHQSLIDGYNRIPTPASSIMNNMIVEIEGPFLFFFPFFFSASFFFIGFPTLS